MNNKILLLTFFLLFLTSCQKEISQTPTVAQTSSNVPVSFFCNQTFLDTEIDELKKEVYNGSAFIQSGFVYDAGWSGKSWNVQLQERKEFYATFFPDFANISSINKYQDDNGNVIWIGNKYNCSEEFFNAVIQYTQYKTEIDRLTCFTQQCRNEIIVGLDLQWQSFQKLPEYQKQFMIEQRLAYPVFGSEENDYYYARYGAGALYDKVFFGIELDESGLIKEAKEKPVYSEFIEPPEITKFITQIVVPKETTILLTEERLQSIFSRIPEKQKLPDSTKVVLEFFDGNGQVRSEQFIILAQGIVREYDDKDYDVKITTGDYYIPRLEQANDLCSEIVQINNNKDWRVQVNSKLGVLKYLPLKNTLGRCIPLSNN